MQHPPLSRPQIDEFHRQGFTIIPEAADAATLAALREAAIGQLRKTPLPTELEVELQYPGAPASPDAPGGDTIRRLLNAYARDAVFRDWAGSALVVAAVGQLLESDALLLNPNHHNCIMTKAPGYSSKTMWHRDTRYWNFDTNRLVNAWLALGDEYPENGGMQVLPGSHRWQVADDRLDEEQFLREDLADNRARIEEKVFVNLNAGDLLLFSAHVFHAAGRNRTEDSKYSLVFTYHAPDTRPLPDTRSAELDEITIS